MKTIEEFNEKYLPYIEGGQGLISYMGAPSILNYLDEVFTDLIQIPGFKYSNIITRGGTARFINNLAEILPCVGRTMDHEIEERLNFLLTLEREITKRSEYAKTMDKESPIS